MADRGRTARTITVGICLASEKEANRNYLRLWVAIIGKSAQLSFSEATLAVLTSNGP
jgi:hypothetical protein